MTRTFDVAIFGAGIAGASLAAELSGGLRVVVLETEDQPGRHATGRSAAMFFESYGNATIRALTRASRAFFVKPPEGFCEQPLLKRRDCLYVASEDQFADLDALAKSASGTPEVEEVSSEFARSRVPILRSEASVRALIDQTGFDIDVASLLQGYVAKARRCGAEFVFDAGDVRLERNGRGWRISHAHGEAHCPIIVNATGAWAESLSDAVGAARIGLRPLRRTAILVPAPADHDVRHWPLVIDATETVYFKPDAGQLLISPANEDPDAPGDAAPDELDVAIAVDRFERATTHPVHKVSHRWAGLRSFVSDRSPVVGFDPEVEGFFWLVGQGGYGIQTSPALAAAAAGLLTTGVLPMAIAAQGVDVNDLSPGRPGLKD